MWIKALYRVALLTALLLLVPLIAMQFTAEVRWSAMDFAVMGSLLFATGLLVEFVTAKVQSRRLRVGLIASVLLIFLLIWAELAVGLFD